MMIKSCSSQPDSHVQHKNEEMEGKEKIRYLNCAGSTHTAYTYS